MKCIQCNKMVEASKSFCNELCEKRYNSKKERFCLICNKSLGLCRFDSVKKTCSNKCRGLLRQRRHRVEHKCLQCNTIFYTSKSRSRMLCSEECRRLYTSTEEHIKNRTTKSNIAAVEKYGAHPFKLDKIKQKAKKTKLKRYGNENFVNTKKAKLTKLKRYGDENYINKEKLKKTLRKKYGVDNYNQTVDFKKMFYENVLNRLSDLYTPNFTFEEYEGVRSKKYSFTCNVCDNTFECFIDNGAQPKCPYCNIIPTEQKEVYEFITEITDLEVLLSTRDVIPPLELDIYIPEKNIAIELNGIFWHSERQGKTKNYHTNKTELCNLKNIQLLHIFDNEWNFKQDIVKSIIQNKVSPQLNEKIYGRKCKVVKLSSQEASEFLEENHIQGNANASVRLGLLYENELVQILTFGKSRYSKKYQYEIIRSCTKKYHTVVGGLNKLFSHFIKTHDPSSIVTFADRRFFDGSSYETLGFKFDHYSTPNYYYFNSPKKLESRIKFQKHKLNNLLENFDPNKTEWENMKDHGYDRIWDCGNSKYIWGKSNYSL